MYYEEKLINGILMFRNRPDGDWQQCSIEKMSERILNLQKALIEVSSKKDDVNYSQDDYMYSLQECIDVADKALSNK